MSWGKIIGGAIGAAMGGPIGAGIGVAIGSGFDDDEKVMPGTGQNTDAEHAFNISQGGNILRLRSRVALPREATRIVVLVSHHGRDLKSLIEDFADEDGDFALGRRIVDGAVAFDVPLQALPIERDVKNSIEILIFVLSQDEPITVITVPVSVLVTREKWSMMRWLYPVVDLYASYALRSGPWDSDKVRLLKATFDQLIADDADEADALRSRLKLASRPTFEACMEALRVRFDEGELARFVFPGVAAILKAFGASDAEALSEVRRLVGILRLHADVIADAERRIHLYNNPDEPDVYDDSAYEHAEDEVAESSEMRRAREVIGVAAGASREEVQAAWRKKISDLHPDRYANLPEVVQNVLKEKAQEINRARDILFS